MIRVARNMICLLHPWTPPSYLMLANHYAVLSYILDTGKSGITEQSLPSRVHGPGNCHGIPESRAAAASTREACRLIE